MANTNIYAMADTWNNAGTLFTAIQMNVTDTASLAASRLMDLQVGGASRFNVGKNADVTLTGPLGGGTISLVSGGIWPVLSRNNDGGLILGFNAGNNNIPVYIGANALLGIRQDAAGILAQANGANAQASRLYNTFTDAANNEWFGLDWQASANVARLRMVANGTGVARPIAVDAFQKAGAAVAGDIPAGTFAVVRDTVGLTTKLIYNNAGTLMTVALA